MWTLCIPSSTGSLTLVLLAAVDEPNHSLSNVIDPRRQQICASMARTGSGVYGLRC